MAVAHRGAISFSLVHIPVNLYTATEDNDISFNQLHKADNSRIKYKKTCSHCGEEVGPADIVRGYQYEKGQYITVSDEEIEKIKTEKDRTIQILQFANLDEISPIYYDKAYHVAPEKGGEKALELLRQSMMDMQKVALGRTVLGSKEKLLVIIPREDGVLIHTLMYQDDIRDIPQNYEQKKVNPSELKLAKQLIENMAEPFDPAKYHDEFQGKLRDLIEQKIAGKGVKRAKADAPGKVIDLMEALRASVGQEAGQNKPGKKPAKKTTGKKPADAPRERKRA